MLDQQCFLKPLYWINIIGKACSLIGDATVQFTLNKINLGHDQV